MSLASSGAARRWQPAALAGLGLLGVAGFGALSVLVGQDNSWDLRNYHYYNPWALLRGRLTLRPRAPGEPRPEVSRSRRIGLGQGREHPYRFYAAGHPCVSRGRPG